MRKELSSSSCSSQASNATGRPPSIRIIGSPRPLKPSASSSCGATAFPKARGVWRDDANKGRLVFDEPVVFHCYTSREQIEDAKKLAKLRAFCRRMGKDTNQGEIGLVIDGEYLAINDY